MTMFEWIKKLWTSSPPKPLPMSERERWEPYLLLGILSSRAVSLMEKIDANKAHAIVDEELEELSKRLPFCSFSETYNLITKTMLRIECRLGAEQPLPLAS